MSSEKAGNAGIIGALEMSTYVLGDDGNMREHVVAYCSNIPLEMRKSITIDNGDGTYSMDPDMYNIVYEVTGQNISAQNERLTHARIVRMRADKLKEDCIISQAWLDANNDKTYGKREH